MYIYGNLSYPQYNFLVLIFNLERGFKQLLSMDLKIKQFWDWFIDNESEFREVTDTKRVVELLNNQVLDFGLFAWEIGKGVNKPHSFTLSANGDRRRLQLSKDIFKQAPDLRHWEFHYCKPIKEDWDFTFEVFNSMMVKQTYDASKWEFVLVEEDDQKISILLRAKNIVTLDYDDLPSVGNLIVINLLGEETKILDVHKIDFVDEFLPEDEKWIFPLPDLREEFLAFHKEIMVG